MTETGQRATVTWRRPLRARAPDEAHRAATPLELFFDLCFVVAVAQASSSLHHALTADHLRQALVGYPMVFFAIWWAWMNFTWFASAYDNDDLPYRLSVLVQILGVLILAAGVPRAFDDQDLGLLTLGYAVMRVSLGLLWLRASRDDPARRQTDRRYAAGIWACMLGWGLLLLVPGDLHLAGIVVMVAAELAVPVWAEQHTPTSWHPHHIAERYSLFTLIVLGESILSATVAIQGAVDSGLAIGPFLEIAAGAVLIVFSMWWMYFAQPAADIVNRARRALDDSSWQQAFVWGYGHYVVFGAAAAVGAGLAVAVDEAADHAALTARGATMCVAVPVALYTLSVWAVHVRAKPPGPVRAAPPVASALVVLVAMAGLPVLAIGMVLVALLVFAEVVSRRRAPA